MQMSINEANELVKLLYRLKYIARVEPIDMGSTESPNFGRVIVEGIERE